VRLRCRRRPAGFERVPTEVLKPELVLGPLGPVILRLGRGRGLLDYPGGRPCDAVANVWPTDEGWAEALWPFDSHYSRFVAPIDLRPGHIIEFRRDTSALIAWTVDAGATDVLLVAERSRKVAVDRARMAMSGR
jgi:hypothetical protein